MSLIFHRNICYLDLRIILPKVWINKCYEITTYPCTQVVFILDSMGVKKNMPIMFDLSTLSIFTGFTLKMLDSVTKVDNIYYIWIAMFTVISITKVDEVYLLYLNCNIDCSAVYISHVLVNINLLTFLYNRIVLYRDIHVYRIQKTTYFILFFAKSISLQKNNIIILQICYTAL